MTLKRPNTCDTQSDLKVLQITVLIKCHVHTKEDIGIEQQLYEIVRGKNFAFNCLSGKLTNYKQSDSWKFGCCALTL